MCVCVVQALIEMAQVLSKEHHSLEVMLSKMAATIMPFTHAQYCTIFIPSEQTSDTEEKVHYLDILLNFLVFHYFVCSEYSTIFLAIHNVFIFFVLFFIFVFWLQTLFSRVIHLECEELGSTCQIYRRYCPETLQVLECDLLLKQIWNIWGGL